MLARLAFGYKVTKPRINDHNTRTLREFRREVHEARRRAHMDAVAYQNKIEDEFLERHQDEIQNKHFKNQCNFRSLIARNSYHLYEQMQKRKEAHQDYLDRLQKHVHEEEVKKLNRVRIKKILNYESEKYWLQGDNINEKFMSQNILPEYIGSTQYYHKLHSEGLAYDNLDFDLLHKLSSTEETVKEKNRMLIPIYRQFLDSIREVKFTELQKMEKEYELFHSNLKNQHQGSTEDLKIKLQSAKQEYQNKVQAFKDQFDNPEMKKNYFMEKTKDLVLMMKKWKEYTDVLSLTSTQILKMISEKDMESTVHTRKKALEKEFAQRKETAFVDPVEEDTEDDEITLEQYLINQQNKNSVLNSSAEENSLQLQGLLKDQEGLFNQLIQKVEKQETEQKQKKINQPNITQHMEPRSTRETIQVDEGYRVHNETTTSIEAMKEIYKEDKQMMDLLNLAGELTIEYPKLFKKIWESQIL